MTNICEGDKRPCYIHVGDGTGAFRCNTRSCGVVMQMMREMPMVENPPRPTPEQQAAMWLEREREHARECNMVACIRQDDGTMTYSPMIYEDGVYLRDLEPEFETEAEAFAWIDGELEWMRPDPKQGVPSGTIPPLPR